MLESILFSAAALATIGTFILEVWKELKSVIKRKRVVKENGEEAKSH